MPAPLASLVPVSDLVHRVVGAASNGVSEGSRRNARAALEARDALTTQGLEAAASLPAPRTKAALPRPPKAALPRPPKAALPQRA